MSDERRQHKRFTVVELDLYLQDGDEKIGKVVNVSHGGVLAITNSEMDEGVNENFQIVFQKTINGQVNFDFEAEIAWCNKNSLEPDQYSLGLEFTENPELQAKFIQQMIKVFGK